MHKKVNLYVNTHVHTTCKEVTKKTICKGIT